MDWLELVIKISVKDLETSSAIANMCVPYGIYIEDYSDLEQGAEEIAHIDLIDEELVNKDRTTALIHIYFGEEDNLTEAVSFLTERLTAAKIQFEIDKSKVLSSEWQDKWKKYFKTTEIGEKFIIRPSWEDMPETDRKVITIDPGAAFGTGTHATTVMCLELIESYAENSNMLDIGTGSGILGIGAALLGAKSVLGVDIDDVAVRVACENAEINAVSDKAKFIVGDLAKDISGKYDVICANIVADAVMALSVPAKKLLAEDGVFICSGIIDIRAVEVKTFLENNGYRIITEKNIDNWYAFAAVEV